MAGYTVNLTDEEVQALEKLYDTDDLQDVLQKNIEVTAQNYILDQYKQVVSSKPIAELKTIAPDLKVERVVPVKVEKEAVVEPVDIEPVV